MVIYVLNYGEVLEGCKEYYLKYIKKENINNIPEELVIMQFYDLVINILNQQIFEYIYSFKAEDIKFIEMYNINIVNVINKFKKYI